MKINQKGFAPVEGLLIFVVVAIVGFTGWYVWHSKQATNSLLNSATSISSSTPKLKAKAKTQTSAAASTPAASTSTTAATTTTTTKTTTPAAPTVTHPTAQDIQQAESQASAIQGLLEAYFTNNGTYTYDLTPGPLINQQGVSGASASTFSAPQGTSFSYQCTKGGPGVCGGYNLEVVEANGTIAETLTEQQ